MHQGSVSVSVMAGAWPTKGLLDAVHLIFVLSNVATDRAQGRAARDRALVLGEGFVPRAGHGQDSDLCGVALGRRQRLARTHGLRARTGPADVRSMLQLNGFLSAHRCRDFCCLLLPKLFADRDLRRQTGRDRCAVVAREPTGELARALIGLLLGADR